jgi:hypothetical protein
MRDLWRRMAVRWLGGPASHSLTSAPALLDMPRGRHSPAAPAILTGLQPDAFRRTLVRREQDNTGRETAVEPLIGGEPDI